MSDENEVDAETGMTYIQLHSRANLVLLAIHRELLLFAWNYVRRLHEARQEDVKRGNNPVSFWMNERYSEEKTA